MDIRRTVSGHMLECLPFGSGELAVHCNESV